MEDFIKRITSWKTTIVGFTFGLITILVATGVIKQDVAEGAPELVGSVWDTVIQLLSGIMSIILLFSKDSDKE